MEGEGFQGMDLGEIQELTDTTPEELTEDDLKEMNASKRNNEKDDIKTAVPENKLTNLFIDNLAEEF